MEYHCEPRKPLASRLSGRPVRSIGHLALMTSIGVAAVPAAADELDAHRRFLLQTRAFMAELGPESRLDARRIEAAYGEGASALAFRDVAELAASTKAGVVRALPIDEGRFNIRPRLNGAHPIGEKDLLNQPLYVAARPATLGLLLHIAAQVSAAPLEVTSLVRHHEYQRALQRTNPNARTRVAAHAKGLAFDISILNVPPPAAHEIRDVLRRMRDDGALYFVAETSQLVFHVVLAPEREQFYEALFDGLTVVDPLPAPVLPYPSWANGAPAPAHDPPTRAERSVTWLLAAGETPFPYAGAGVWILAGLARLWRGGPRWTALHDGFRQRMPPQY